MRGQLLPRLPKDAPMNVLGSHVTFDGQTSKQTDWRLAAGWKIVNERLKDIEALERRNKSQIKYEVDKAFEMAKYLDDTNLTKRDPATSQAYTSMVQMFTSKLEELTPLMILQKLDKEKQDLHKLL